MGFDPWNRFLKIQKSTETPIPKVGAHLGVWGFIPSHYLAFSGAWNVNSGLPSWPTPLQAIALVASPRLGIWQEPSCSSWMLDTSLATTFFTTYTFTLDHKHAINETHQNSSMYIEHLPCSHIFKPFIEPP